MALEKFHYTTKSGKKLTLPKFTDVLKFGLIRKMRKMDEEEQMYFLFESVLDEKQLEVVDDMKTEEVGEFIKAWQEASGAELPKSDESSEDD